MRVLIFVACFLSWAFAGSNSSSSSYFELRSVGDADCNDPHKVLAIVKIPFGCLNNHDFASISCGVLSKCLGNGTVWYEDLVNCTGANSMHLSVDATVS